ncbi:double-stranded RNA-specific adenosine deaminase-like [Sinocyclocheilus grahami]|uniref:double-stranded RNA-specific adenosine deaminase-like n=1 Tax=Sinocyclocheilus grahami TaxID=75366 RepID=UPI0007ACA52B|nr:PREDICTED: double-stranded RNA-specific adenosine deaminase-like [Sinocyclocheilus grahami]
MASEHRERPIGEQPSLLESVLRNCFPALQSLASSRGEVARLKKTVQIVPPHTRRFTCQVVLGERHFPLMSAGSRTEAREEAIQAATSVLLGEEELQRREEERLSSQPSCSSSSQKLVKTEVKEEDKK